MALIYKCYIGSMKKKIKKFIIRWVPLILSILEFSVVVTATVFAIQINSKQSRDLEYTWAPQALIEDIICDRSPENVFQTPDHNGNHFRLALPELIDDPTTYEYLKINNSVPVLPFTEEEKKLILDTPRSCFFIKMRGIPTLMLNISDREDRNVVEMQSTKIIFHNYGSIIQSVKVDYVKIRYKDRKDYDILPGTKAPMSVTVNNNEDFVLNLAESSNFFEKSICEMNNTIYENLPLSYNLFEHGKLKYVFQYDELIFGIRFTNINGDEYCNRYVVTVEDDVLVAKMEKSSKKEVKKVLKEVRE